MAALLTGCGRHPSEAIPPTESETIPEATVPLLAETTQPAVIDPIAAVLEGMTTEERVGQLFLARHNEETALADIQSYHLGGFILFSQDFKEETQDSIGKKIREYQQSSGIPLLMAVDEEGGTVTRISRFPAFRDEKFPSARDAYRSGGMGGALDNEREKCELLACLGLNVNMGPVCDLSDDPNGFMYLRSFGQTPETTGEFIAFTVDLMEQSQIGSVLKHFPGYGNNADTHVGMAVDSRSLEELEQKDLVPFQYGIRARCGAILVSHTIVQCLDETLPASLSPAVHAYLRENMGFDGVIVTDDLVMEAITDRYGAEEAAVMALQAGNDLLCASDYAVQYEAVLAAVLDGRISSETLDRAVYRVLKWKMDLGLL